jgi:hypothetical protein
MLGRQEVQRARALIHAVNYKSSTGDTGVIELEKARRRLRSARVAVDVARKERDEVRAKEKVLRAFDFHFFFFFAETHCMC